LNPDLSTFGKAMANGFSVSAVCGKKKIMELGSVVNKKQERVFLLSTTHGAEMGPLSAFIKTIDFVKKNKVIDMNWKTGFELSSSINRISKQYGLIKNFVIHGPACSPVFSCFNNNHKNDLFLRTLFIQEMIKNGVLMPWISIAYRHKNKKIISKTLEAVDKSLYIYKKALKYGVKRYLIGPPIKPVFRKYN
jgi:glutamate-1-semialdehyde 2,1-aminomutase